MGSRLLWTLTTAVLLVVVAAGCSGSETADEEASSLLFDCANPIDILDAPPDGWIPILDVVALPDDLILQQGRFDGDLGRRFSKFGLVIRADRSLTLAVAKSSRQNILLDWNLGSATPVQAIEVTGCSGTCVTDYQPNCPLGESGEWVVCPGGIWSRDPACIEIEIAAGDQRALVELPIGQPCE